MIKLIFTTLILVYSLNARENPFFPTEGEKQIAYTSNQVSKYKNFENADFKFPSQARVLQNITITYKNLDGSIETKDITINKAIDWHKSLKITQNQTKNKIINNKFISIAKIKFVNFLARDKELKLITSDKLIRSFLLVEPHRLVYDFKRISHLKSYTKIIKNSVFRKIKVGNHADFYRVVVELDGYYEYNSIKIPNGVLIRLK